MKYAVRFVQEEAGPIYTSPWIYCRFTDESGVMAEPADGALNRIISLDDKSEDEWGSNYAPELDPEGLMRSLHAFLNRDKDLAMPPDDPF